LQYLVSSSSRYVHFGSPIGGSHYKDRASCSTPPRELLAHLPYARPVLFDGSDFFLIPVGSKTCRLRAGRVSPCETSPRCGCFLVMTSGFFKSTLVTGTMTLFTFHPSLGDWRGECRAHSSRPLLSLFLLFTPFGLLAHRTNFCRVIATGRHRSATNDSVLSYTIFPFTPAAKTNWNR